MLRLVKLRRCPLDATVAAFSALDKLKSRTALSSEAVEAAESPSAAVDAVSPQTTDAQAPAQMLSHGVEVLRNPADGELYVSPSSWPPPFKAYLTKKAKPMREGLVVALQLPGLFSTSVSGRSFSGSLGGGSDSGGSSSRGGGGGSSATYGVVLDLVCPDRTAYVFRLHDLEQGIPFRKFHPQRTVKLFTPVRFSLATAAPPFRTIPPSVQAQQRFRVSRTHVAVDICKADGSPLPLGPALLDPPAPREHGSFGGGGGDDAFGGIGVSGSGVTSVGGGGGLGKFRRDLLSDGGGGGGSVRDGGDDAFGGNSGGGGSGVSALLGQELDELCRGVKPKSVSQQQQQRRPRGDTGSAIASDVQARGSVKSKPAVTRRFRGGMF